jgi:hypothetical protein
MNEQIAKFANESGFDVDKTGTFGNYSEIHRLEKFAELIVRECADICEDEDDGSIDTKSVRLAMIRIKKHFGVEEL